MSRVELLSLKVRTPQGSNASTLRVVIFDFSPVRVPRSRLSSRHQLVTVVVVLHSIRSHVFTDVFADFSMTSRVGPYFPGSGVFERSIDSGRPAEFLVDTLVFKWGFGRLPGLLTGTGSGERRGNRLLSAS